MLSVLAPSSPMGGAAAEAAAAANAEGGQLLLQGRAISYDKFATMMQQSFRRRYT